MSVSPSWRAGSFGVKPARVANCSGFHGKGRSVHHYAILHILIPLGDPANELYKQVVGGDVDFITGDYLAG
jgi:hypothetical protein